MANKEFWNLNIVYNFMRLAELGNVTKAASDLFITQPALSHQISRLESELNVQLFNRGKSGVTLTEKGQAFYQYCKELISAYDNFIAKSNMLASMTFGRLNIGYTKSSQQFIFAVGQLFLSAFPDVVLKNIRQSQKSHIEMLANGELDMAYIHSYDFNNVKKDFRRLPVMKLDNMLLVSKQNPLAEKESVSIADLEDCYFIFPDPAIHHEKNIIITQACKEAGYLPKVSNYYCQIADYLMELNTNSRAVTIIPYIESVASSNPDLVYIPISDFEIDDQIYLTWLSENPNPLVSLYIRNVKSYMQSLT